MADLDLTRTRLLARDLRGRYFAITPWAEDPEGRSKQHMAWMLDRIVDDSSMTLAKASRWLGYVQGWLVFHHRACLADVKADVRLFRDVGVTE